MHVTVKCIVNSKFLVNYNIHKKNIENSQHNGVAIAIRRDLQYKLEDDFDTYLITASFETKLGKITIAQHSSLPDTSSSNTANTTDYSEKKHPVYFLGDLNARHRCIGNNDNNHRGIMISKLINRSHIQHPGPQFPTFINHCRATKPDITLSNNKIFHHCHLSPGPLTPSDNIPIPMKISANPIQIPIRPRPSIKQASLKEFRNILASNPEINIQQQINSAEVAKKIATWTNKII